MLLSGLFTTRGPTSRYFLGRRDVHTCGGSITWSSTDTILGIVGIEVSFSGGRDDLSQVRPRAAVRRTRQSTTRSRSSFSFSASRADTSSVVTALERHAS